MPFVGVQIFLQSQCASHKTRKLDWITGSQEDARVFPIAPSHPLTPSTYPKSDPAHRPPPLGFIRAPGFYALKRVVDRHFVVNEMFNLTRIFKLLSQELLNESGHLQGTWTVPQLQGETLRGACTLFQQ